MPWTFCVQNSHRNTLLIYLVHTLSMYYLNGTLHTIMFDYDHLPRLIINTGIAVDHSGKRNEWWNSKWTLLFPKRILIWYEVVCNLLTWTVNNTLLGLGLGVFTKCKSHRSNKVLSIYNYSSYSFLQLSLGCTSPFVPSRLPLCNALMHGIYSDASIISLNPPLQWVLWLQKHPRNFNWSLLRVNRMK